MKWILIFAIFIVQANAEHKLVSPTDLLGKILSALFEMNKDVKYIIGEVKDNKAKLIELQSMSEKMYGGGEYTAKLIMKNHVILTHIQKIVDFLDHAIIEGKTECHTLHCHNGGTCIHLGDEEMCLCLPGYTGLTCETAPKVCRTCKNGDTCFFMGGHVKQCMCPPDFTGSECAAEIVTTAEPETTEQVCKKDCKNGGTCFVMLFMGVPVELCICPPDFTGSECEIVTTAEPETTEPTLPATESTTLAPTGPCVPNPCQNGAQCYPVMDWRDYFCHCTGGFTGKDCDKAIPPVPPTPPPKPTIPPGKSCRGICGRGPAPDGCYCDADCKLYKDCCKDYVKECEVPSRGKRSLMYARKSRNNERKVKK